MARAYIVLARNDLDASFLQALDLWPNVSQRNAAVDPPGQSHYLTHYFLDGINTAITINEGPPRAVAAANYGLSGYAADTIERADLNRALTTAQATGFAVFCEGRVAAGLPIDAASCALWLAANVAANTALGEGAGTATVEEILRILAGERYQVPAGALEDGGPNFVGARRGAFRTRPNVEQPESVRSQFGPVRGRNPFVGKAIPTTAVAQTAPQDLNFNDVLVVSDTGRLQQSALNGVLSKLASPSYSWINPAFTYGGGATPATTIDGVNIPATGVARAVTVYAADGSVIV